MAKHSGLGKGLDALLAEQGNFELESELEKTAIPETIQTTIPSEPVPVPAAEITRNPVRNLPAGISVDENGTLWVNPNLLKPNPHQPRHYFDEEKLAELTESVKKDGVLNPVIIEDALDGTFYIIAGERRTRAARAAGLERVPIMLKRYSDSRKLEVALIENIQRTDLNPVEEAEAYYEIMQLEGITQDEVAERVGKSRSAVANAIRLLRLPEDIRTSLAAGTISAGHARALLSIDDPRSQRTLYKKIQSQGISVRQTEKLAQEARAELAGKTAAPRTQAQDTRDPNLIAIEQKFIEELGTKVQVRGDFNSGTIIIDYFTKDDLDRIYNRIVEKQ